VRRQDRQALAHPNPQPLAPTLTLALALAPALALTLALASPSPSAGKLSPTGDGIPFTFGTPNSPKPDQCGPATAYPGKDGLYNFSEAHNAVYLAYQQACGAQPPGECNNTNIELMWNRWQARHLAPHRMPSGR